MTGPRGTTLEQALAAWLPAQRWFAHKGHDVAAVEVLHREVLADATTDGGPRTEHLLLAVELADGTRPGYQVPLGLRAELPVALEAWALEGPVDGLVAYDALRDPECIRVLADALAGAHDVGALQFRTEDGVVLEPGMGGRVLGAEQSNTSVVLGEHLLLKVFRQVAPGVNPDLELHRALSAVGCSSIAPVRAWLQGELGGETTTLAMAQDFATNAADGWSMALTSVRDLLSEADLHAEEVGTDFAGEAERLGRSVAEVHQVLATALGSAPRAAGTSPVPAMLARLDAAVAVVPELAELAPAAHALLSAAAEVAVDDEVQRIHGDLHLGQVLRTPAGWLLIDFEGEPAKTLAERREADSTLRDVAGMLRSFDYAAHQQLHDTAPNNQLEFRAKEWAARNTDAFCAGYAEQSGADPRDQLVLLRAYELDKAVYEAVYEARNRPTWLDIPLKAVARLCGVRTRPPLVSPDDPRTEEDDA
ncbi:phosphotransferase [Rhodococcus antarcticus]|uniref:Maltokinase n=1 Tax=Rhodococcus antarcticus TaxID=2987751 RepID=A0ABY6P1V2_9NOCA|nr:phosphotransferase [Rhodococcus antarcticus]UZJ25627.1 phosphotransferase [Rhodococcus antarcticus]